MTDRLIVGKITRPHGLKGQVEVMAMTDNENRFVAGNRFQLDPPINPAGEIEIISVGKKKNRLLILFSGYTDREAAERLSGRELLIGEEEARKPAGTYWRHEIIGCRVRTADGRELGQVIEIVNAGETDVYIVGGRREYRIPAIKDVVKSVDVSEKLILIDPLPGLLEL